MPLFFILLSRYFFFPPSLVYYEYQSITSYQPILPKRQATDQPTRWNRREIGDSHVKESPFIHESVIMCDCHEIVPQLQKICDQQIALNNELKSALRRSIPIYLTRERSWQTNATQIILTPQSHNLELVTAMLVQISAPGGGTLQLGPDRLITLQQGFFTYYGLSLLLNENDPRILTQGTPGAMALEFYGQELVDRGPF